MLTVLDPPILRGLNQTLYPDSSGQAVLNDEPFDLLDFSYSRTGSVCGFPVFLQPSDFSLSQNVMSCGDLISNRSLSFDGNDIYGSTFSFTSYNYSKIVIV